MPNRILKESICTSENIDQLSPFAEITFYRLMVNCDDYGRMDGRTKILRSRLFPLRDIDDDHMMSALNELEAADLIRIYHVDGKSYLQMTTWGKHQQIRNMKSRYPSPTESNCNQLQANDINCNQLQANVPVIQSNPNPNPNRNPTRAREDAAADDEAHRIAADHNTVLDAAEDAGFQKSNSVRAKLIDLYAQHGLEKVLAGIASCVQHGAPNLAYLTACMRDSPKPQSRLSVVPAQAYGQRDYSGDQQAQIAAMMQGVGDV